MRLRLSFRRPGNQGYAIVLVTLFAGAALLVLAGAISWTTTNTNATLRNNQYFRTAAAAEAATEKVIARMANDYQNEGDALVNSQLATYRTLVPAAEEGAAWADYEFKNASGHPGLTHVEYLPPSEFRVLASQYRGLRGYASSYRIISNARELNSRFQIVAAVRQDIEVATIPVFQFAIFYNIDLEVNPGATMVVTGPVHGNSTNYFQPAAALTFNSDVTCAGPIIRDKKPGDPVIRSGGSVTYRDEHDAGVSSLTLPIGTNNSPASVREVVEVPPGNELATSPMGQHRYYNKADLIVVVTNGGYRVTSGRFNNFASVVVSNEAARFVNTSASFFNKRENKTIKAVEIDVGQLKSWSETNKLVRPTLGRDIRLIYVLDTRTQTGTTQPGVRVVNGQTLPSLGLTIATPLPLYVKGHFNAPASALGTTNTSQTKPASLVGDAITILSTAWSDANAGSALSGRNAASTTVNAAFLAGIVETVEGSYSGGVENFPRFLENWSGDTFTYNGSMVVMYPCRFATAPWLGTGTTIGIYNPPTRNWAFDLNFRDMNKIPPGCPSLRVLVRGTWAMTKPNTTTVVSPF